LLFGFASVRADSQPNHKSPITNRKLICLRLVHRQIIQRLPAVIRSGAALITLGAVFQLQDWVDLPVVYAHQMMADEVLGIE
jgi:hypothetical protein